MLNILKTIREAFYKRSVADKLQEISIESNLSQNDERYNAKQARKIAKNIDINSLPEEKPVLSIDQILEVIDCASNRGRFSVLLFLNDERRIDLMKLGFDCSDDILGLDRISW